MAVCTRVLRRLVMAATCLFLSSACGATSFEDDTRKDVTDPPSSATNQVEPRSERHCTVTDSNGPLEGGEMTTSGCRDGEICVCSSQAGYSCAGVCKPLSSSGEALSGTSRDNSES